MREFVIEIRGGDPHNVTKASLYQHSCSTLVRFMLPNFNHHSSRSRFPLCRVSAQIRLQPSCTTSSLPASHPPSLLLRVHLPTSYPSQAMPVPELVADWLPDGVKAQVVEHLLQLVREDVGSAPADASAGQRGPGRVVIFEWAEWLKVRHEFRPASSASEVGVSCHLIPGSRPPHNLTFPHSLPTPSRALPHALRLPLFPDVDALDPPSWAPLFLCSSFSCSAVVIPLLSFPLYSRPLPSPLPSPPPLCPALCLPGPTRRVEPRTTADRFPSFLSLPPCSSSSYHRIRRIICQLAPPGAGGPSTVGASLWEGRPSWAGSPRACTPHGSAALRRARGQF